MVLKTVSSQGGGGGGSGSDQTVTNQDGTIVVVPSNGVGNVVISANLAQSVTYTANITYTNITVAGKATLNITEVNSLTIDNNLTVINNVTINNNLTVINNVTFENNITIIQNAVVAVNALSLGTGNTIIGNATGVATQAPEVRDILCIIDGGGSNIAANTFIYMFIDFNCSIQQVTLLGSPASLGGGGNIVVNIATCTYAQFDASNTHPVLPGDSITSSHTPTLSSNVKYQDSTLTGWTTTINAGSVLMFGVVNASANIFRAATTLKVNRLL